MDKLVVSDNEFIDALKESIIEIIGESNASQVTDTEPGIETAGRFIQVLGDYLKNRFGIQSARGLLIRIGRSAISYLRRNHRAISSLGTIENRLSSIHHRFEPAVNVLFSVICPEIGKGIIIDHSDADEYMVLLKDNTNFQDNGLDYIPYLLKGLIETFGSWLDSRQDYEVKILEENEWPMGRLIKISIKKSQ